MLTRVLSARAATLRVPDTAVERDAHSRENLELAERLGDPVAHWAALADRLTVAIEIADAAEVERSLTAEVELSGELAQPYEAWITLVHQAWHTFMRGRLDESEAIATRGLELGLEIGQPDAFVFYGAQLFVLREAQGRLAELIPILEQSIEENPNIAGFRAALSLALTHQGDTAGGYRLLAADAATDFADVPRDVVWSTTMSVYADAAAALGATAEGTRVLEILRPYTHLIAADGAHVYKPVALSAGVLAARLGHPDAATLLDQARAIATSLDAPLWHARALIATAGLTDDPTLAATARHLVHHLGPTAATVEADRVLGTT